MPSLSGSQPALMYCQSGVERCGATRTGYHSAHVFITIGGTQVAYAKASAAYVVDYGSLSITDILDETPNRCHFTIHGFTPTIGQEVIVQLGSTNHLDRLFAGHILTLKQLQIGAASMVHYDVNAIDYTWLLGRIKVVAQYTSQSATVIARALISSYASGFTSVNVAAGLATIDTITFTNEDLATSLTRLAKRIGAYWYVDEHKDLHFYTGTESTLTNPTTLTTAHTTLSDFAYNQDLSQVITRVYVEGGGVNAVTAVAVGETILPVQDTAWYNSTGGIVACGPQRITYTGIAAGGGGSIVGQGIGPAGAPALALVAGVGLSLGLYEYAYTFVTAAGESLPSPIATVTTGVLPVPSAAPTNGAIIGAGVLAAGTYKWAYTFVSATGETTASPLLTNVLPSASLQVPLTGIAVGAAGTTSRKVYRTIANGSQLKLVTTIADNVTTTYTDSTVTDAALGANVPTTNTATGMAGIAQVALSSIGVGTATVTQRKVYRSIVAGTQLKLLATIADNTTTTYADSTADGSLGANVPTSDTSGLTQPTGQALAGATSFPVAGASAFSATGGWALIGNGAQVIRYTGLSGNTLTGIPASGGGSITATISYNSTITAVPALIGIPASGAGAILYAILTGDAVNLVAQVDSSSAQSALATALGTGDGVQEDYLQDGRLSYTEAAARGTAILNLRGATEGSLTYASRDTNTHSGRSITASLAAPTSVSGTFKIQEVTISDFSANVRLYPTYTVSASSTRFSLDDLLRLARKAGA